MLPKLTSPRPSAVGTGDGEQPVLAEWKAAVNEEAAMRKRIAKLQRELQRKKQQQSASELQRQRDTTASILREELNEARGSRMMHLIADVLPASEDELNQLSKLINTKCLPSGPGGKNVSWYACFKNLDTDHSGSINFKEYVALIRTSRGLNIPPETLSDMKLKSIWKAVDEDNSGLISVGEFGHFMRRGESAAAETAHERLVAARLEVQRRQHVENKVRRDASGRDISALLDASEPATEEELQEHSHLFNRYLFHNLGETNGGAWYKVFKAVDTNLSGLISFSEYEVAVRDPVIGCGCTVNEVSDAKLRRLWKALDANGNGTIDAGEWGRFMKRGQPAEGSSPRARILARKLEKQQEKLEELRQASDLRYRHLAAPVDFEGIQPASAADLGAMSRQFTERLAHLYRNSTPATEWYRLFKLEAEQHLHHVGGTKVPTAQATCLRIGFEELCRIVRIGMQFDRDQLSDKKIKRLWKALDEPGAGFVEVGIFGRFMRFGIGPGMMPEGNTSELDATRKTSRTHQQRVAEVREAKLAAVLKESTERLKASALQAQDSAAAAALEMKRLEEELASVAAVELYSRNEAQLSGRLHEELIDFGYALSQTDLDELRRLAAEERAVETRLNRAVKGRRGRPVKGERVKMNLKLKKPDEADPVQDSNLSSSTGKTPAPDAEPVGISATAPREQSQVTSASPSMSPRPPSSPRNPAARRPSERSPQRGLDPHGVKVPLSPSTSPKRIQGVAPEEVLEEAAGSIVAPAPGEAAVLLTTMPLPPMSPALDEVPEEATSAPAHIVEDEAQEVADEDASSEASSKKLSATPLRLDGDGTIPSQMRRALQTSLSRVIDLFRQFDDDASGYIDGPEFVKALAELGFDPDEPSVSALFASFDQDDSGTIEYEELHNLLVRSVQHKPELEPLELKAANRIALRKKRMSKVDANLFSGLELGSLDADAIPGAIRKALDERMVRVIDLFRQFDDDSSGLLDASEFAKAMRELGMTDAPPEAIAAVFASFDHDESGTIEYRELHAIIKRSLQDRPVVPLLGLQTANRITLRTKRVLKANANLLEGLDLDEAALHSIPGQIKGAMQASLVRVVDLFRQFDDDGDGRISFDEFGKAMGELGLDVLPQALRLLFDEWDPDQSGYIEYEELYTLLRHAK